MGLRFGPVTRRREPVFMGGETVRRFVPAGRSFTLPLGGDARRFGGELRLGGDALRFGGELRLGGDALRLDGELRLGGEALRFGGELRLGGEALRFGGELRLGGDTLRGGSDRGLVALPPLRSLPPPLIETVRCVADTPASCETDPLAAAAPGARTPNAIIVATATLAMSLGHK